MTDVVISTGSPNLRRPRHRRWADRRLPPA